ncbi:hypothetical protein TNCV_3748601 [Trichonephila clavipes]|nr:hypothetical protein TNCV_3748601 [Trichonephila clavipes]
MESNSEVDEIREALINRITYVQITSAVHSERLRYPGGQRIMSSSRVLMNNRRIYRLIQVKSVVAHSFHVVRRGGCQLRCRPRHLTMVQNYVVRHQKPSCS